VVTFILNKRNADKLVEGLRKAAIEDPSLEELADYIHAQAWNEEMGFPEEIMEELIEYASIYKDASLDHESVLYYQAMEEFLEGLTKEF